MEEAGHILQRVGLVRLFCVMALVFAQWSCAAGPRAEEVEDQGNLEEPSSRLTAPLRVGLEFTGDNPRLSDECTGIFSASDLFLLVAPGAAEVDPPPLQVTVQTTSERRSSPLGSTLKVLSFGLHSAKERFDPTEISAGIEIPSYSLSESVSLFRASEMRRWRSSFPYLSLKSYAEVPDGTCDGLPGHVIHAYESFLSEAWTLTQNAGDIESYEKFLAAFPHSRHSKEAASWIDEALWDAVSTEMTPEAYRQYLDRFPNGRFAEHVRGFQGWVERNDWKKARHANTAEAYREFVDRHPTSGYKDDPTRLSRLFKECKTIECSDYLFSLWDSGRWKQTQESGSRREYAEYLYFFPNGKHAKEATDALVGIDWVACKKKLQRGACELYLSHHKRGRDRRQAESEIVENESSEAEGQETVEANEDVSKFDADHEAALARIRGLHRKKEATSGADLNESIHFHDELIASSDQLQDLDQSNRSSYEQMMQDARDEIERLLYGKIVVEPSLENSREYLRRFPNGQHRQQVVVLMEPLFFEETTAANTLDAYQKYLKQYPAEYSSARVRDLMEPVLWAEVKNENSRSAYGSYLRIYPDGRYVTRARTKLSWMEKNPAIAEISHPRRIVGRGLNPKFRWVTSFSEESGDAGYSVSGTGWIVDSLGQHWGPNGEPSRRGTVIVEPGETAKNEHSFEGPSFCGGKAQYQWEGQDTHGHAIRFTEKIRLICRK